MLRKFRNGSSSKDHPALQLKLPLSIIIEHRSTKGFDLVLQMFGCSLS
jgi:hypothetical protein